MKIQYVNEPADYRPDSSCYVAHIGKTKGEQMLLKELYDQLHFPEYFGFNWDALFDCLCDLHWIDEYTVVMVHDAWPELNTHDISIYIEILIDAIRSWEQPWSDIPDGGRDHEFRVVFPFSCKSEIESRVKRYHFL